MTAISWSGPAELQALWNASPDAMVLTDADGLIVAANPAYCALHGHLPDQMNGQSLGVIFPEAVRPAAMARYRTVFASHDHPQRYPAIIQLLDGWQRLVESRVDFLLQNNRLPTMMSSVRVLSSEPTSQPMPSGLDTNRFFGPLRPRPGVPAQFTSGSKQTTAEVLIDGLRRWGIDAVFQLTRAVSGAQERPNGQRDEEPRRDAGNRLDRWEDDGGATIDWQTLSTEAGPTRRSSTRH